MIATLEPKLSTEKIYDITISEIFSDEEEFNSRGEKIYPGDILSLKESIAKDGLQSPILVRPIQDAEREGFGSPDPHHRFKIVSGHRRFAAAKELGWHTIKAIIKENLTEVDALTLNFIENLERKDLNIKQEAHALKKFFDRGFGEQELALKFHKSKGWVRVRRQLLDLEPDIQKQAAAGFLTQDHIKQIYYLKPEQRLEACKAFKDHKLKGDNTRLKLKTKTKEQRKKDILKRKRREPGEINEMIELVSNSLGFGICTRLLAWANGNVSTREIYFDIKEECDALQIPFVIPAEIKEAID